MEVKHNSEGQFQLAGLEKLEIYFVCGLHCIFSMLSNNSCIPQDKPQILIKFLLLESNTTIKIDLSNFQLCVFG